MVTASIHIPKISMLAVSFVGKIVVKDVYMMSLTKIFLFPMGLLMFRKNRQANVDFEQKIKYSGYSDKPIIRIGSYLWVTKDSYYRIHF